METCRICLQEESLIGPSKELIQPCMCTGTAKYVHRDCLDEWRANKLNRRAFTHCSVCNYMYTVQVVSLPPSKCSHAIKARIARDSILVFLFVQLIICGIGALIWQMDTDGQVQRAFPDWISDHEKTTYYVCGVLVFFVLLGLIGFVFGGGCRNMDGCWYCGFCEGGSGQGAEFLFMMMILLVVFLFFIGLFVGIALASMWIQQTIQRRAKISWLREQTLRYKVVDRSVSSDLPLSTTYATDRSRLVSNVTAGQQYPPELDSIV